MTNKNTSYRSSLLLNRLNESGKLFFSIEDAANLLDRVNSGSIRELLSAMTNRGLIMRIKDGLYHIIPYEKNSTEYFPNWHLTAEAIAGEKTYYLGFYTALDIHGLITQPSLIEQIVTTERLHFKNIIIKDIRFEIITYNKKHFFGFDNIWIDDFNKVFCSNLEKTIIDCLYKPHYANGITEILKAIYRSRDKINTEKLLQYLEKFDAQVVYKRLGLLLMQLNILLPLQKEIQSRLSTSYALLDPSIPKHGRYYSEWKIIDNVEVDQALKSIGT